MLGSVSGSRDKTSSAGCFLLWEPRCSSCRPPVWPSECLAFPYRSYKRQVVMEIHWLSEAVRLQRAKGGRPVAPPLCRAGSYKNRPKADIHPWPASSPRPLRFLTQVNLLLVGGCSSVVSDGSLCCFRYC